MPLAFGYCRGNATDSIERQMLGIKVWFDSRRALDANLEFGDFIIDKAAAGRIPFVERTYGSLLNSRLQSGDTVVCAKLGYMFRNHREALNIVEDFRMRGIRLVLLDLDVDTSHPDCEQFVAFLSNSAEWEHSRISESTKEGLARRKSQGRPHARNCPRGWKIATPRTGRRLKRYAPDYEGLAFGCAIVILRDRHGVPASDIQLSAGVIGKSNLGNNTVFAWDKAARTGFLFNGKDPLRIPEVKASVLRDAEELAAKLLAEVLRRKGHWAKRQIAGPKSPGVRTPELHVF